MDLFPGASLEFRVYVLLGAIGVMFFAAILALGVGRLIAIRSSSNLNNLTSNASSPFGGGFDEEDKPSRKKTKVKKEKPRKEKPQRAEDILNDLDSADEEVEYERKVSFFGRKKKEAVEMLAKPSGYTEEYAPTHTRDLDSEIIPEFDSINYENNNASESYEDISYDTFSSPSKEKSWEDEFLSDDSPVFEDPKKNQKDRKSSPFGGDQDWDL